jgi:hypothetical protein
MRRALPSVTQAAIALLTTLVSAGPMSAATFLADSSTYKTPLSQLSPGDTLLLAPGIYNDLNTSPGLPFFGVHGQPGAPIVICGADTLHPPVFYGRSTHNTIRFDDASYVTIRYVTVDGRSAGGDAVKAQGVAHHIVLERVVIYGVGASQQNVGISTKAPCWNWTIRGCEIREAGTGLYLGNSDGTDPFVAGIIENNLVVNTIGYNMQIKYQVDYTAEPGMPTGPSATIIRHNVFIKDGRASPDGTRPNVLVDGFAESGPGAGDHYEIYGNFFYYNASQPLFQASGRVHLHDNVLVNPAGSAVRFQAHDGKAVKTANVYNNTVYASGTGIALSGTASEHSAVIGNLVFAATPISGSYNVNEGNITDATANAATYVVNPSTSLGAMDFYPRAGQCTGAALDLSGFAQDLDYERDFNGSGKGGFLYRGAYAGDGANSGWDLDSTMKSAGGSAATVVTPSGSAAGALSAGAGCRLVVHRVRAAGVHVGRSAGAAPLLLDLRGRLVYGKSYRVW